MARAKILVVDDNPDIVEMVQLRLQANDYSVVTALDGMQALEKAESEQPDLILLDISMPGMDGFETGSKLKKNPVTEDIPIIMVTAKGQHNDVLQAIAEVGAKGYVIKPYRPEVLLEKVETVLRKKGHPL
ncbi:MAG: response regulator [Candidatus Omnitrophica bacterium]|nr:response regulator [Candidatus Omnitrophota bacterium]